MKYEQVMRERSKLVTYKQVMGRYIKIIHTLYR